MKKKVRGIHDITTPLDCKKVGKKKEILNVRRVFISSERLCDRRKRIFKQGGEIVSSPRVWTFSTKPKFKQYQKPTGKNLLIERVEEPKTNVLEKMGNLVIMAELPEVKKKDIHWEIDHDIFSIHAQDRFGSKKYMKEMLLPFVVEESNIQTGYREGIFEITFCRKREKKK